MAATDWESKCAECEHEKSSHRDGGIGGCVKGLVVGYRSTYDTDQMCRCKGFVRESPAPASPPKDSPNMSYFHQPSTCPCGSCKDRREASRAARIPFDKGTDEDECAAANGGFECTLLIGHDGDHVAHGLYEQELARWPASPPTEEL